MNKAVTTNELMRRLRRDAEAAGSQRALARQIGVSVAYLSDVFRGRRNIGPAIAKHYGLKLTVRFERIETYTKVAP